MKVAVSACLLGVPCRYDGRSKQDPRVQSFVETGSFKGLPVSTWCAEHAHVSYG